MGATPALAQWFAAKADHPDALLFFRMGDFFELFFEDAERAGPALDIAVSHRGEHQGRPVPMASPPRELAMGATFGMGSGFFDASGPRNKVVVRKRPMARKEAAAGELDVARAISKRSLQVHEIKGTDGLR
jgi:DNA mismatch repair protein MutS